MSEGWCNVKLESDYDSITGFLKNETDYQRHTILNADNKCNRFKRAFLAEKNEKTLCCNCKHWTTPSHSDYI